MIAIVDEETYEQIANDQWDEFNSLLEFELTEEFGNNILRKDLIIMDKEQLISRLKDAADTFATVAHTALHQGLITWEKHEKLMEPYRQMMGDIVQLDKELQGEDDNEH